MSEYDLGQYDVDRSDLDTILDNGTLTGASSKYVRQARPSDLTRPCFRVTSASSGRIALNELQPFCHPMWTG